MSSSNDNKKNKEKNTDGKNKKSLLIRLTNRRSTKIEPQNDFNANNPEPQEHSIDDNNRNNHIHTIDNVPSSSFYPNQTVSAHSSPQKLRTNCQQQINIRRSNSSQNLSINKKSNRLSYQFNLCCSSDDKSLTPLPTTRLSTETKLNSILQKTDVINPLTHIKSNDEIDRITQSSDYIHNYHESPSIEPNTDVRKNSSSNITNVSPIHQFPVHSINEQFSSHNGHIIAYPEQHNNNNAVLSLSESRSRFRERYFPSSPPPRTSKSIAYDYPEKHFSSPNIPTINETSVLPLTPPTTHTKPPIKTFTSSSADQTPPPRKSISTINQYVMKNKKSISYDLISGINRPASTDSLAKQTLLAAQVLSLVPIERARERNFLSGRLAANSLLGATELDRILPGREIKIFVGTWNMNGQHPPKQMNDFVLPSCVEYVPDLVVIGTQESCSERFEWEVTIQETIGPTHILLHSTTLGTLHLCIFIRRDLIWFCSVPEDDCLSVRPGTAFRTKGAVAISFSLFGTSLLFVTSHLTAHQQKVKERVQDVKRIIHSLDLPRNLNLRNKNKDVTQNFDAVYWCGDLNFRLSEPREKLMEWIENTKFPLPSHLPHGYMHTDQLKSVLSNGAAFKDFKEANITFPPTYKYDPGTQQFDTSSKQRAPAYTDRVLFKYKTSPLSGLGLRRNSQLNNNVQQLYHVECLAYDSVPSIVSSDHKPVWALFRNPLRPGIDSIPLAAGLFNREVYLEGMRRRLMHNNDTGNSTVCSIQ